MNSMDHGLFSNHVPKSKPETSSKGNEKNMKAKGDQQMTNVPITTAIIVVILKDNKLIYLITSF